MKKLSKLSLLIIVHCLLLTALCSFAGDSFSVRGTEEISPDVMEGVRDAIKKFQKPMPPEAFRPIIDRSDKQIVESIEQGVSQVISQDQGTILLKEIYPNLDAGKAKQGSSVISQKSGENTILYFFSFSMPASSIKETLKDAVRINKEHIHSEPALYHYGAGPVEPKRNVVMVLRGFVDNNLKSTIKGFYELTKEMKLTGDLPVEINPELFDKYSVVEVPTIIQISQGDMGIMKGDVRIGYALSRFDEELKDYGKYSNTYPIKEDNILEVIEAKQELIEKRLKERLAQIRKHMYVLKKYDGKFERAKEDRVYYVDHSVILTEDITDHTGKVLFAKGSKFNPSDYVSLGRYIIIDGKDPEQVKFALDGNFKKVILISGDLEKLTKKYRNRFGRLTMRFYFANDLIIARLNIQRVPSIIEQEGKYIRVTEKALP